MLERPIGRDLKRLCGALVLRVLQQLLLGAGAAEKIKRALAEGEGLADETLESPYACHDHAPTLAELLETLLQGCRVGFGLAKVALQVRSVGAARRHCDVGLQGASQRLLAGMGFVEVLDGLLG